MAGLSATRRVDGVGWGRGGTARRGWRALLDVLEGHTANAASAKLCVAVIRSAVGLDAALAIHEAFGVRLPIWIVHGKGPTASFGGAPVRGRMRARGYRDTKVSAVADALSATRYSLT